MEFFKGDDIELKFYGSCEDVFKRMGESLQNLYEQAYNTYKLGEIIYDNKLAYIVEVIPRDIFIRNFNQIFDMWSLGGNYESYIYIFKQIFGPDTDISFERLRPGALKINIETDRNSVFAWIDNFAKRRRIKTREGKQILLRQGLGINDFYQVEGVLNSLKPAGIFLQVNLIIREN